MRVRRFLRQRSLHAPQVSFTLVQYSICFVRVRVCEFTKVHASRVLAIAKKSCGPNLPILSLQGPTAHHPSLLLPLNRQALVKAYVFQENGVSSPIPSHSKLRPERSRPCPLRQSFAHSWASHLHLSPKFPLPTQIHAMRTSHALLIAVCITLVAVNARTASSWQADQDDDYFRLSIPSTQESRKPAIVNPKKSALPIGAPSIPLHL